MDIKIGETKNTGIEFVHKIHQEAQLEAEQWREKIGLRTVSKYRDNSGVDFVDPLPYYKSLKKYEKGITRELYLELIKTREDCDKIIKNLQEISLKAEVLESIWVEQNAYIAFKFLQDYQVLYSICRRNTIRSSTEDGSILNKYTFQGADAFADIKVYNSKRKRAENELNRNTTSDCASHITTSPTYAYLWCDVFSHDEHNVRINMEKVGNYFTFKDIIYDNPLFQTIQGSKISIYTDADTIEYKNVFLDLKPRDMIHNFNRYAISHFPSLNRLLFAGHVWWPSFSCSYEEIINIPLPQKTNKPLNEQNCIVQ